MKITVVGTGYVGISLAALISQHHQVVALDIDQEKVDSINSRVAPIEDTQLKNIFKNKNLSLKATKDNAEAYKDADHIIISTPTNYDPNANQFDVSSIYSTIDNVLSINKSCSIFIKSTIPLGFTNELRKKYKKNDIYFSPEFLREGTAVHDNMYPSRIIVGGLDERAKIFSEILYSIAIKDDQVPIVLLVESIEAEAIKLFSNTFLAMRISFFNELDSYCEVNNLEAKKIIEGVCHEPRIGNFYNNPSFGYGGYCLPKDTQQLLRNFDEVPNNLIKAIVDSNKTRKDFIISRILDKKPKTVGIYRLIMKKGSDNFRDSAIQGIMDGLHLNGINIVIYEPFLKKSKFSNYDVIDDFKKFTERAELIVSNRKSKELEPFKNKVYTRDIFKEN